MDLIYWSFCSSSMRGGYDVKGVDVGNVILSGCEYHFIRAHKNLVQHPSYNILITIDCNVVYDSMN